MFGGNAWRLGSIGGIEVKIDPSWSIIAFLIGYTFYAILGFRFTEAETTTIVAVAVVMTVVFFASVLLHELAHSWVARSRGVEVRGITLFLFGGATHADLETEDPTDELLIAIVGPLTSLGIAGVLWAAAVGFGDGTTLGFAAGRLGWINLALAVFNMLPGFPLDGGRVLRSLTWRSTGDIVRATRIAARGGQWLGYGLMALGVLEVLFLGALIGGLWLVAIGWFLAQAAQASFLQLQVRRILADVPASAVMSRGMVEIPGRLTLQEAVDEYFMRHDFNAFPVGDGDGVRGLITLGAVRQTPREDWSVKTVDEVKEPLSEACTVSASDRLDAVVGKLMNGDLRRVLVTEDGEITGIITPRDLTQWLERSRQLGLTGEEPARPRS